MASNDQLLAAFNLNSEEWDIEEGYYRGGGLNGKPVTFLVFTSKQDWGGAVPQIQDTGGRRTVELEFPYTDGQTTDDLGQKGEHFDVEILFFGPAYKNGLNSLLIQANKPQPGTLLHPVRGTVTCKLVDYTLVHSATERKAVMMRARFAEHDFDAAALTITKVTKSTQGALSQALSALQTVNNIVVAVKVAIKIATSAKNSIIQAVESYRDQMLALLSDFNNFFNATGTNNFPGLLPTSQGGLLQPSPASATGATATGSTQTTAGVGGTSTLNGGFILVGQRAPTVVSPTDPFANLPTSLLSPTTNEAIAVTQLTQRTESLRVQGQAVIALMESANNGAGSYQMRDLILGMIQSAIAMQEALEAGIASSNARLVTYTVPTTQVMCLNEVAFANGLTPDDAADILLLNPALQSANYIPGGTALLVARPT